jgi:hypothetical protein
MKKGFLGFLASLLSGVALAFGQSPQPLPSAPPAEAAQPAPTEVPSPSAAPAPATDAASTPTPQGPPVDRQPWNPSLYQGVRPPFGEPPHSWFSGLCPDLEQFWLSADYLLWVMRSEHVPALVTTNTSVLIGNTDVNQGTFSGGLFTGGVWLDDDHIFGFEGSYLFLAEQSRTFSAAGSTLTATTGLQGAEATGVIGLTGSDHYGVEMLFGFRYLALKDFLGLTGAAINPLDQFDTHNHYYAGQVGIRAESCYHGWLLGMVGKLALGANEETLDTAGASPGHFAHSQFAVVPEFGIQLGYQLSRHARLVAGYTLVYWSEVVRSGDQIVGVTGPTAAAFSFHQTDFWAQGGNFGLEFRY